jgi:hypothetical protein
MPASPSTENYLYGKGEVLFKPTGGSGYLHLGNCPAFGLNVELEKAEHYSSMAGTKEKDLTKVIQKTVKAAITMEELSVQNLNLVLMGGTVATAAQVEAELDGTEVDVVMDQYVPISDGKLRLSDVVVADAATSPTTTYAEGTDYLLNREAGMIMALSGGSISESCFVSATVNGVQKSTISALSESSVLGELYFVGNPDIGPKWQVKGWKVELSLSGEIPFISDDVAQITVDAEFQADRASHPSSPFFEAVNVA